MFRKKEPKELSNAHISFRNSAKYFDGPQSVRPLPAPVFRLTRAFTHPWSLLLLLLLQPRRYWPQHHSSTNQSLRGLFGTSNCASALNLKGKPATEGNSCYKSANQYWIIYRVSRTKFSISSCAVRLSISSAHGSHGEPESKPAMWSLQPPAILPEEPSRSTHRLRTSKR